jgi:hypothetical protein
MDGIDEWLQRLSWLALIALPVVLGVGGWMVLRRLQRLELNLGDALGESRLQQIVGLIAKPGIRDAHTLILTKLPEPERKGEKWWEENSTLNVAAEQICSTYDYIGGVINFDTSQRLGQFFLETWGEDVIRVHDILERYLKFRRESGTGAYNEFSWLAQEAKLIHRDPQPADPEHPVRTVIRILKS